MSQPWLVEAVGTADWTGTPLAPLLREAGIGPGAVEVAFTGADHGVERGVEQDYARALSCADALRDEALLAYEMNGMPLPPQHGFPVRLIVPGWYGMAHVKWLRRIDVLDLPFDGFQNRVAYRFMGGRDEVGEPVTRIRPRALIAPPGWPDFMSRARFARPGRHLIEGRAWSGRAPVTAVEVSTDAGLTWQAATLQEDAEHPWAWRRWSSEWEAVPGQYELLARATDAAGGAQPLEPDWNRQGVANNGVQRVPITVLA